MILSGEKKEEYRATTPYYRSRFSKIWAMYPYSSIPRGHDSHTIRLRNGYSKTSPSCLVQCTFDIKTGWGEWGAGPGIEYYVLHILSVEQETAAA